MTTPPQRKLLAEAIALGTEVVNGQRVGKKIVNGRRMMAANNLEAAGLATTETWIEGGQDGGRWQVRVTPTAKGKQHMKERA